MTLPDGDPDSLSLLYLELKKETKKTLLRALGKSYHCLGRMSPLFSESVSIVWGTVPGFFDDKSIKLKKLMFQEVEKSFYFCTFAPIFINYYSFKKM